MMNTLDKMMIRGVRIEELYSVSDSGSFSGGVLRYVEGSPQNQNPAPYMSFVNTVQFNDRGLARDIEVEVEELPVLPCSRFLSHMHMHEETFKALYANKNTQLSEQKSRRDKRISDALSHKGQKPPIVTLPKARVNAERPSKPKPFKPPTPMKSTSNPKEKTPSTSPQSISPKLEMKESPEPHIDSPIASESEAGQTPPGDELEVIPEDISSKKKKTKEGNLSTKRGEISKVDLEEPPNLQLKVTSEREPSPAPTEPESANQIARNPLEKRVRWRAEGSKKQKSDVDSVSSDGWKRKESGWLYGDDDFSTTLVQKEPDDDALDQVKNTTPTPPRQLTPSPTPSSTGEANDRLSPAELPEPKARQWGSRRRDESWEEEQRRLRLAQERRDKAQAMYERLRRKRIKNDSDVDLTGGPNFEESDEERETEQDNFLDGWLAKYCIFKKGSLQMFKRTFDTVDEDRAGYLGPVDTIVALRTVNNRLSVTEEEYVYRILELVGYKVTSGSDFKLFAVMAALSQRISALDDWMKHLIGKMDFGTLERKMFMCKSLWECNVDPDTNTISIDQLCVELRAGGVSFQHEREVREKLDHLGALDLIDFMTYIPLFIMIHTAVLSNPLDDSRSK